LNIAVVLSMAADAHPERVAIVDGHRCLTYAQLRSAASSVARRLPDNAHALVSVGATGSTAAACMFGAAWAGCSYAPVNHRLPSDQVAELARRRAPAQAVAEPSLIDAVNAALPGAWTTDDVFTGNYGEGTADAVDDPSQPALLLYTSGTTSEPKAAVLGHDNLMAYLMNTIDFGSAADDEAVLVSVPPFHIAGVAAMLSAVWAGRRIVALDAFSPTAWLDAARAESVTHAFVVPTMLTRIVDAVGDSADVPVPSLRTLAYGGARMPIPVLERALRLFRDVAFVNAYGLTETSSTIAVLGPDVHRAALRGDDGARRRLGSVGRPLPGVEIEIVDDDGAPVHPDVEGRVRIRGAQVSGRYAVDERDVSDEGWLTTGDIGWVDVDGYLFIGGRADDVVIRGGENIAPAEIEDALLRHPSVADAAVVGVPDDEWGERLAAAVVVRDPDGAPAPEELREHVRSVVGSLKCPDVVAIVDALPMTDTGKVVRGDVRRRLAAEAMPR